MKKKAFTLVELIIATGLLSLIVIAITYVYSGSSKGFQSNSWKMTRQKEAQLLLTRFKEAIERRSHFNIINADGRKTRIPIRTLIAGKYFNKIASSTNTGIIFASHCTPVIKIAQSLNMTDDIKSQFKGFSLECYNKSLAFVQSSNPNYLMETINTYPLSTLPSLENADIVFYNERVASDSIVAVDDVDSIRVTTTYDANASETCLLTLEITMLMPKSKGKTTVTEKITAKLSDVLDDGGNLTIISGAETYSTSKKRK